MSLLVFEDFKAPAADRTRKRRFAASTGLAMVVYAAIGASVVVLASPEEIPKDEDLLDVTFEHTLKKEAPPPPPPKIDKPPPKPRAKPAMVAPTVIPDQKLAEADPAQALAVADAPDPTAAAVEEAAKVEKPVDVPPPPPPPKPRKAELVSLPEDADPPEPCENNEPPKYPEAARTAGIEGKVILKLGISETGAVIDIKVLKGDPMLAEAALAAVKTWCFSPAKLDGKPIAVYKIQSVAFSSSVGG
jgi:protein TonB